MKDSAEKIREAVREHYADRIRSSTSCCAPETSANCQGSFYPAELLDTLPKGELPISYGCGDPITLASLEPGQTVLDLGSGAGLDCFFAAGKVGPEGRVIGVDMTPEMIARARAVGRRLQLTNVEFRQGLLEQLPVQDNSIDVVISNCVINLAPDKAAVFREIHRVLRAGGRLAASDIVTSGPLPAVVKTSMSAWAGCIAGALDIEDYRRAIQEAGLGEISITPIYFDETAMDEAIRDIGEDLPLKSFSRETIAKSVFSAKITARKP